MHDKLLHKLGTIEGPKSLIYSALSPVEKFVWFRVMAAVQLTGVQTAPIRRG
jgi:hypothetical protein